MRFDEPYRPPLVGSHIDLDLSRNEGRAVDPEILDAVAAMPGLFNRYPDSTSLRDRIAAMRGVAPDRVLVTAGGDDALLRTCSAFLIPGRTAITTTPTFEMVPRYAALQGADVVEVVWKAQDFPLAEVISGAGSDAVCIVVSPNNPTGEVISADDLADLSHHFAHVVLDGAYMEFADVDLTARALSMPNVSMIRTLSKAWGLAGLRVGYLLSTPDVVRQVALHGNPYPVSRISLAIAERRLEQGGVREYVDSVRRERDALASFLADRGLATTRSQGNFVYAESQWAGVIAQDLASSGIAIRRFPDRPWLERAIRITVPGDQEEFGRLTDALERAFGEMSATEAMA